MCIALVLFAYDEYNQPCSLHVSHLINCSYCLCAEVEALKTAQVQEPHSRGNHLMLDSSFQLQNVIYTGARYQGERFWKPLQFYIENFHN